ncbi:MAG TPA: beta-ketoacyl-ACP synthase II [Burkholderiaceae bacterium]|nr:beta-ketoacyl-ACP synthase II [Burkholderiaceae bacterium]
MKRAAATRRVVVTGLGAIAPVGLSAGECWSAAVQARSGIARVQAFDPAPFSSQIAGEVKGFEAERYLSDKEVRRVDRFVHLGFAAAVQAVEDARLGSAIDKARAGVYFGSGIGGLGTIEASHRTLLESGPRRVSPFFIPGTIVNMTAGLISMRFGFTGPNLAVATACTTGAHSIGEAAALIARGAADVMIAGGSEAAITPLAFAGFCAARAMSTRNDDPAAASRPWDRDRDGFVLGEGGAALVLESLDHAARRGARIYAELVGFGMSADAFHMTQPPEDGRGAFAAMQAALASAELEPDRLDYINAHATSTQAGDIAEARAIERLLGGAAGRVAVSSTKGVTGHLLGAAGAIEAVFTVLAIHDGHIPPTANLENPDPGLELDLVPGTARERRVRYALSNSFGFGGTNAALLFAAP